MFFSTLWNSINCMTNLNRFFINFHTKGTKRDSCASDIQEYYSSCELSTVAKSTEMKRKHCRREKKKEMKQVVTSDARKIQSQEMGPGSF